MIHISLLKILKKRLKGELLFDNLHKNIYATDASVYRKIPTAVAFPKYVEDIQMLIEFANENDVTLVPRTAGTSLAGQCVSDGIIVDVSKYFTNILSFDEKNKTITVEPGIIRDDLNRFLEPRGLFFGPNTSTSNRCMIGGMVGNNSSGSTSIQYGVTRDKVLAVKAILSDGSVALFSEVTSSEFKQKSLQDSLEGKIYKNILLELNSKETQEEIKREFPKPSIHRRNTGYAVDEFLTSDLFGGNKKTINIAKFLSGSEGTLAFSTAVTLQLDELPPAHSIMIIPHFTSINESLKATVTAMKHNLFTCELMDKVILDCTKNNREQAKNRFFLQGDPEAVLMLELKAATKEETERLADALITDLKNNNFGYHHPKVYGNNIKNVLNLRKAGLGLLGNMIGDRKAVACIEDTAVDLTDLPEYIEKFTAVMNKYQQQVVYYAHAGAGELHLRPILNLKKKTDIHLFRKIATETAALVKKYNGSLSGEHGDGIVRSEFIPLMIGKKNYQLLKRIKKVFDPNAVFNKGKITDTYKMDENLRYETDRNEPLIETLLDFSDSGGILRLTEKCSGSGDCRKSPEAGGTLCPSYRATLDEKDTTRARANALREFLTNSDQKNKFNHSELKKVFDLCLSCKACAGECPSNVDVASLKAEFLYQYQESNGYSFRNKLFANNVKYNKLGSKFPAFTNFVTNTKLAKAIMGIAPERNVPKLAKQPLTSWFKKFTQKVNLQKTILFNDEFTNFYDTEVGKDAVIVLNKLGYYVEILNHKESGRSYISKGFLKEAKKIANKNIAFFKSKLSENKPLIGIEPSAILTFRDEYLRLADDKNAAKEIAQHTFTIEEFLSKEIENGAINSNQFTSDKKEIKIHGHCHQKSLSTIHSVFSVLNIPKNYTVTVMNTGCCGMAGSFGYEKEHYSISMQVGEDTLFPKIRKCSEDIEIASSGTSCRHQIFDGTNKEAKHPITLLKEAIL